MPPSSKRAATVVVAVVIKLKCEVSCSRRVALSWCVNKFCVKKYLNSYTLVNTAIIFYFCTLFVPAFKFIFDYYYHL